MNKEKEAEDEQNKSESEQETKTGEPPSKRSLNKSFNLSA